jgi:hypothetical protein
VAQHHIHSLMGGRAGDTVLSTGWQVCGQAAAHPAHNGGLEQISLLLFCLSQIEPRLRLGCRSHTPIVILFLAITDAKP